MAVYEEQEAQQRGLANTSLASSPDVYQSELSVFQPIAGGEIEVNSSALKSSESYIYCIFVLVVPCSYLDVWHFPFIEDKPTPLKSNFLCTDLHMLEGRFVNSELPFEICVIYMLVLLFMATRFAHTLLFRDAPEFLAEAETEYNDKICRISNTYIQIFSIQFFTIA